MNRLKILIADDHAVFRMGLRTLLEAEDDLAIVGEATNGLDAVRLAKELKPDVVIMDLVMPRLNGIEATRRIRETAGSDTPRVFLLTSYTTSDGINQALAAGAAGAMLKNADNEKLVAAIRSIAAGKTVIAGDIRRLMNETPPLPALSSRQAEVLDAIARGLSDREIAALLDISVGSVKTHVLAVLAKIGAANRTEAAAIAMRKHLPT